MTANTFFLRIYLLLFPYQDLKFDFIYFSVLKVVTTKYLGQKQNTVKQTSALNFVISSLNYGIISHSQFA